MTFDPRTSGDTPENTTLRRTSFRSAAASAEKVLTVRELLSAESTRLDRRSAEVDADNRFTTFLSSIYPSTTGSVHLCTRTDLHHDESTVSFCSRIALRNKQARTCTQTHISNFSPKSIAFHLLPAVPFRSSSILSRLHDRKSFVVHRVSKSCPFFFQLLSLPSNFPGVFPFRVVVVFVFVVVVGVVLVLRFVT